MSEATPQPTPGNPPPPPPPYTPPPQDVASAQAPSQPVPPPPPAVPPPQTGAPSPSNAGAPITTPKVGFIKEEAAPTAATQDEKLWGLLSVLLGLVGAVLALIIQGQSRFVKFYALQTLFVCVAMIPVSVVLGGACFVLLFIPFIGPMFAGLIWLTFLVAMFAIMILVAIKAFNGLIARLPVVGDMAYRHAYGETPPVAPKA